MSAFGVWPLAHPGHGGAGLMVKVDLVVHIAGAVMTFVALRRWVIANADRTISDVVRGKR